MEIQQKKVEKDNPNKEMPEGFKKKLQRNQQLQQLQIQAQKQKQQQLSFKIKEWLTKAQKYEQEYKQTQEHQIQQKRTLKKQPGFFIPAQPKVFLVVRIRGIMKLSPKVNKILRLLRLRQIHNVTFVRINKSTINMIRRVQPFIAYGYPSRYTIKKLIYKRGYAKLNKQRIPITSNEIIEEGLGKLGINCVEDVIHQIVTFGPHFKEVLDVNQLRSPRGGYESKRHPFNRGGDWGNRQDLINDLIKKML